ncbi:asparagine synthase (glutamine-hydrolyzing) [Phycisphaera mikurensis]|uniref:asparagine synthase (glutamine-hydrolyzing) n=1 Tax=Phycisphaera mikurensis (strain NBRC 102666 / KCTC 22515 / FYK2301M01) TaxID=1142394 RepID=I0IGJ7_PHYMF|nr:asparagine synthase (glutamine-hydrolyzing) [Phycisphaera mikurensis]MBB6442933.1 asparagine synthase (glutamine-hydrolyzing) [Phycisphaera mikurensis]BAM04385.1 putative asparagine synthetase [Phycisphaera mikurensis NBRC 102666]
MCGFAGLVNFNDDPVDERRLGAMLAAVEHRGPDGRGTSVRGRVGLVHARLAVIDLLSGQQPMSLAAAGATGSGGAAAVAARSGPLRLVFNGEIYNHRSLRKKLSRRGDVFTSDHSDTEVLLHGYRRWGPELPKHLDGMFAFALVDDEAGTVLLCRDRVGLKPLYIARDPGGRGIAFGSTVAAVTAGGPERRLNPAALRTYLRFGYTFEQSIVSGVEELPPASTLLISAGGGLDAATYWRPPPLSKSSTEIGLLQGLREVLGEAVSRRLEADVPLGCFLSGGVDSSLVAALAQAKLAEAGAGPLRTFSVAMPAAAYDETSHAETVAAHLGVEHTTLPCRPGDAIEDLHLLMRQSGEPTADSSLLPQYWLAREARAHIKVAISGDGGDELFGGYDRYRAMRVLHRNAAWIGRIPASLFPGGEQKSRLARLQRLATAGREPAAEGRRYASMIELFGPPSLGLLLPDAGPRGRRHDDVDDPLPLALSSPGLPGWPAGEAEGHDQPVHSAMRWDFQYYLPHEVLRKVDRASMAVALEVRCPLLDRAVSDLAGHVPPHLLMPRNRPKGLLRRLAAEHLPAAIVKRRKQGFAVPIGHWMRGELKDALADHLASPGLAALGIDTAVARTFFDEHQAELADHTHRLFALLQLSIFAEQRGAG